MGKVTGLGTETGIVVDLQADWALMSPEHPKYSVMRELEDLRAREEIEDISLAMREEHEHTRWLARKGKNPSPSLI